MSIRTRHILRVAVFLCILAVMLWGLDAFTPKYPDFRNYQSIHGFHEEPQGTLQGVYIGTSSCYAFWNSLSAWNNYGMAIFPYCNSGQPIYAVEHLIRETRKTQPNALFIVNINAVHLAYVRAYGVHSLMAYMPESKEKTELRDYLLDLMSLTRLERLEFKYQWLKSREYWYDILKRGLYPKPDGMKASSVYDSYLNKYTDIADLYITSEKRTPIPEALRSSIESLLDYCEAEQIRILFVSVPRAEGDETQLGRINYVGDMIRDRGYDVLYLTDKVGDVGLDLTQDYADNTHTNIHGSLKYTRYLCEYLREHYGLEDRRGDSAYASWDEGWKKYLGIVSSRALDFELEARRRDSALPMPSELKAASDAAGVTVSWDAVDSAEEYRVYRKRGDAGAWQSIASTAALSYVDAGCEPGTYHYTVVPVRDVDGETCYGNFSYQGVSARVKAQ